MLEKALCNEQFAYELSLERLGSDGKTTSITGLSLANLLAAVGSVQEARELFDVSLKWYENRYGRGSFEVVDVIVYMTQWFRG